MQQARTLKAAPAVAPIDVYLTEGKKFSLRPLTGLEIMQLGQPDDTQGSLAAYAKKILVLASNTPGGMSEDIINDLTLPQLAELREIIMDISGVEDERAGKSAENSGP